MMTRTTKDTKGVKRAAQTLVVFALIALLAGCSLPPRGGQTAEAASLEGSTIPGSTVSVDSYGSYNGFQKVNHVNVHITVKPGFSIRSPGKLVDFLIRLGWSVNDNEPNTLLMVAIDSPVPIDATAAAKGVGWKSAGSLSDHPTSVFVDLKEVEKRLGGWPGKVPATPAGLVVKAPASPDPSTH